MKTLLKYNISALIITVFSLGAIAQTERTRDFNETWNGIKNVTVDHRHGTLEVVPYGGDQVKLEAQLHIIAKEEADAQILLDHFEIKSNASGTHLEIETKLNTKSWSSSNNTIKIKFDDGTKITGIKKFEIKYKLHVPALESLNLSNKYHDIEIINDFTGDLTIKQHDATIKTQNVSGLFNLYLKYGRAYIGATGDMTLDIYDSKVEIPNGQNLNIKAKYSNIEAGQIQSAKINSYDGYCKIESVIGDLSIVDKYSDYNIGTAHNIHVDMYDGNLQLDHATKYSGKSKYSGYSLTDVSTIDLETTHDDDFNIGSINIFSCGASKYTSFELETISGKATILSSYDDEFLASTVASTFDHFEIDCKYTSVKLPLTALSGYEINAKMKYGKLSYTEPSENIMHKENNEQLELRAHVGDTNSNAKIIINAYDSGIRLK